MPCENNRPRAPKVFHAESTEFVKVCEGASDGPLEQISAPKVPEKQGLRSLFARVGERPAR